MNRRAPFDSSNHIITEQPQDDMDVHMLNYVHYNKDKSVKSKTGIKRYYILIILSLLDVLVLLTVSYQ